MENSSPGKTKSMLGVEEEVGEIKSHENPMGEALKDARGEVKSGTCWLINPKTLGQGSTKGGMSDVNVGESWLEVGCRDQSL